MKRRSERVSIDCSIIIITLPKLVWIAAVAKSYKEGTATNNRQDTK
jgi:hypothetical protein